MTEKQQSSPLKLGSPTIETGAPTLAPRKGGGGGSRGSRYDPVLDACPNLKKDEGHIRVSLEEGTEAEKAIGALRVAIKRRFGKEAAKSLKVRELADGALGVFRV